MTEAKGDALVVAKTGKSVKPRSGAPVAARGTKSSAGRRSVVVSAPVEQAAAVESVSVENVSPAADVRKRMARVFESVVVPAPVDIEDAREARIVQKRGREQGAVLVKKSELDKAAEGLVQSWQGLRVRTLMSDRLAAVKNKVWCLLGGWKAPANVRGDGVVTPASLADVQAAVMNELALRTEQKRGQGENVPLTKPFMGIAGMPGSVVTAAEESKAPDEERGAELDSPLTGVLHGGGRGGWFGRRSLLIAGVAIALVLAVLLVQGKTPVGPMQTLVDVRHSIITRNVASFERTVDVDAVTTSAVNQLFGASDWSMDRLPPHMRAVVEEYYAGPQGQNGVLVSDGLKARVEAYLKPGLADDLRDDLLSAVAQGSFSATSDGLLEKMWRDAGGVNLRFGTPVIVNSTAEYALAEVPLQRVDLNLEVPLKVEMMRLYGKWQVVDLPNVAGALNQLVDASTQRAAVVAERAVAELSRLATVNSVAKARMADGRLLVTMTLTNTGPVDLHHLRIQVVFADAANQPMKVVVVEYPDVLASGARVEQAWPIAIDEKKSLERYVRDLPINALTVRAGVIGVTMPSGRQIVSGQ